MSVVWATFEASHFHWARHRPTAAAGRLHTITSRANLVLWHMHVPLPWHMHLCLRMIDRCRVTRPGPANSNSTLLSFASGPEIGKGCALCNPTMLLLLSDPHNCLLPCLHTIVSGSPGHETHSLTHQTSTQPLRREPFIIPRLLACMHFGALYPALYCFWASNSNSLSQSSKHYNTSH